MEWRKIKKKIEDNLLSIVLISAMLISYIYTYIHAYKPDPTQEELEQLNDRLEALEQLLDSKKPFTSENIKAVFDSVEESKSDSPSDINSLYSSGNYEDENGPSDEEEGTVGELVLICTSETSHAYHYYMDCMGLHSCKAGIDEITLEEAKRRGRTPCHFCREREATELDY